MSARQSAVPAWRRPRYAHHLVLLLLVAGTLVPLYFMVVNAFKTDAEYLTNELAPPSSPTIDTLLDAFRGGEFFTWLKNSFLLTTLSVGLSIAVGLLSTAILVVNNVRDIDTDRRAGKKTLAVRLGRERTRNLYVGLVYGGWIALIATLAVNGGPLMAGIGLASAGVAVKPLDAVKTRTDGPALNGALAGTGAVLGAFSLLVSAGLLIAS